MSSSPQEPTLRDIAKELGISHVTVSRALHDDPRISVARRQQVKEAATRLRYRPNPMATALGQQRHTAMSADIHTPIAWLNFWDDPAQLRRYREFDLYWKGASEAAARAGFRLEEFSCNAQTTAERISQILHTRQIHHLLIPPHQRMPASWDRFPWHDYTLVKFGYSMKYPPAHTVTSDHLTNSLLAYTRMRERGYQRIGFITSQRITTRFKAGFLMMQLESKPTDRLPILILKNRADHTLEVEPFQAWMKKSRPDAILTDIALMPSMLAEIGYQVPADVGLAALSVLDGGASAGIYQNSEDIGKAAVELIVSQIRNHHVGIPAVCREVLTEGRWVDGDSLPVRSDLIRVGP